VTGAKSTIGGRQTGKQPTEHHRKGITPGPTARRSPVLDGLTLAAFGGKVPPSNPKPKSKRRRSESLALVGLLAGTYGTGAVAAALGVLAAVAILAVFVVAVWPPRDQREVLPPIPRRALDALPPDDRDGTP
jgi:hypothetical protein